MNKTTRKDAYVPPANPIDDDFVGFCRNATDSQLEEILRREWDAPGHRDYNSARMAAAERGWTVQAGTRIT